MNVCSHMHIGMIVHRSLKRDFGIYLNPAVFCYGSMRPDFSPKHKHIPHYKNDMYESVTQEIVDLTKSDKDIFNSLELADRLGVVCHYLCDFFCYAHSEKFTGTLREHLGYENQLNRYIKQRRMVCNDVNFLADVDLNEDINALLNSLDERYNHYISLESNMGVDMVSSIQACIEVTVQVLYIIVCKAQLSHRATRRALRQKARI